MRLFDTLGRSWRLFKSSAAVIRLYPKLLVFPALTAVFTGLIVLFFAAPIIFYPTGQSLFHAEHWTILAHKLFKPETANPGTYVPTGWLSGYGVLMYLVSMFMATFTNVAFSSQIIAALNGEPVSIRRGFLLAGKRVRSILVWSLFAGVVGLIIRKIEERMGFIGRIVVGLIGVAWSIASVFAIPVIIREEPTANPVKILTKSAGTIKRTWGEMLTGFVGLHGCNGLVVLSTIVVVAAAAFLATALSNYWMLVPIGAAWVLAVLAYSYFASVASQVYLCAVYIYASEGVVPEPYDQEMMDRAWKVKTPKN